MAQKIEIKLTFIKPFSRRKQFTGIIFSGTSDLWKISGISRREEIFFSKVVNWRSEYRVYIIRSQIVRIYCYEGNPKYAIDRVFRSD